MTVQGSSDGDYVPLEFTGHPGAGTTTTADEGSSLSGLADVLETDLLAALGELEKRGVKLPDAETVPFELCGKDGEVLAEAELGWEDRRVVFAYARDEDALKVFASAGWTARKVEELVACPGDFVDLLKAGDQI